jgi:pimeloyl-ACP methyl ester carboxylesterase
MNRAKVDSVELEYEEAGSGEPVLLISPVVAGAFVPFLSQSALVDRFRLIRYHRRGWGGSTHTPGPVGLAEHAADAAGLLEFLGVDQAHVAGHSSGGAIALQLALDRPDLVHSLVLLEPTLLSLPGAQELMEKAAPCFEAYHGARHAEAVIGFLSVVSGFGAQACRTMIDVNVPDGVAQAIGDADTFFGVELPALAAWEFGPEQAATISQPVASMRGADTGRLWVEVDEVLGSWLPRVETLTVPGVGHLLQMQRPNPVARMIAGFLARQPMLASTPAPALRA